MSAIVAKLNCPSCGRAMRVCAFKDAMECRCGVWVDGEVCYYARQGQAIPACAVHQGDPWIEPAPGLRVSDNFGDIGGLCWETAEVDPDRVISKAALERACADAFECSGLRYVQRSRRADGTLPGFGWKLILESGDELERNRMYAIVPLGQEVEAVRGIVRAIRRKHGPGRLWAYGEMPINPSVRRTENGCRGAEIGGVMHVVLGCYYFHKPAAASN